MSCLSPFNKKARILFKEQCDELTNIGLHEKEQIRALVTIVVKCANFFTIAVQPVYTDQGLAYAISQYGSEEIILVSDDDYPDLELQEWCSSDLLPIGLRKAAMLSGILHEENTKKFSIKEGSDTKKYLPKEPYIAYLKSTGQRMPFADSVTICVRKIFNNRFCKSLAGILIFAFLFAIGGAIWAPFVGLDPLGGLCGGALLGVAYRFILSLYNWIGL